MNDEMGIGLRFAGKSKAKLRRIALLIYDKSELVAWLIRRPAVSTLQ
jgi:hypothetical protein